jgi:hypothetical protein
MADPEIDLNVDLNDSKKKDAGIPVATATAIPMIAQSVGGVSLSVPTDSHMDPQQIAALQQQGFPYGLAVEMGNTRATYPRRFWVVDNSGSMRSSDGHQIRGTQNNIIVVECNRWTELQDAVEYHAELAGLIKASTVFRMLNDPGATVGPQEFSVADTDSVSIADDVVRAKHIIRKSEPGGVTPLTAHIMEIRERIRSVEHVLRSQGQRAVIVLATDGLPSNSFGESSDAVQKEFIEALRSLQSLPIWIVVRLCTDDDEVVEYYNNLDQVLELPLEVIDDFFGEAKEIHDANKWLNYALPLHRCREMGYQHRIFDLLDERLLNKDELREFLQLLFGSTTLDNAPNLHSDWKGFVGVLSEVVKREGMQWNPISKKMGSWIDMKQLQKAYGKGGFRLFGKRK